MQRLLLLSILLFPILSTGQYEFSGRVNAENTNGNIYLSVVDNYRKISGVYPEQILNKTTVNEEGYFTFKGDNLPAENKIYRIHVDSCNETEENENHFTGHCINSQEIVFIANNTTQLSLPFSFESEMFCSVVSTNEKAKSFLKIDSLKADMRYAFGTYRSEANRKLNSEKWFGTFQNFGEELEEPLAELYSYAFFSDRKSSLYNYYLEDLKTSDYYQKLLQRLETKYPNSTYTKQYKTELAADKNLQQPPENSSLPWWVYLLASVAVVSLLGNYYFFGKMKDLKNVSEKKQALSSQEQKVLDLILADKSNKEIAAEIFVSVSTVKTHINNLYKKLGVSSRDEVKARY